LVTVGGERGAEAKTALREWAMTRALPAPSYRALSRAGTAHAPVFTVEVRVEGYPPESARGPALRVAEKAAARKLLAREGGAL
ncbi:MAG: putative dsRNA-binding protein, partial [Caulobacteraceae bacterium]